MLAGLVLADSVELGSLQGLLAVGTYGSRSGRISLQSLDAGEFARGECAGAGEAGM